ncbi:hypothetical protein BT93_B2396 [Corymbia citriodora subsp. variegata]|nr:hypothetical protein BT93_B2396 [Corymbia citriodora subsp. variegata]
MRTRSDRRKSSRPRDDDSMIVPEELLIEILKRLPVKSLCRFTCVSTRWHSLISDPYFIDSHLTHSATRPKLLVGFFDPDAGRRGGVRVFSDDQSEPRNGRAQISTLQFSLGSWNGPYVLQSHEGLICLEVGSHVKICNPSTGKHVNFRLPGTNTLSAPWWSCFQQAHSFGFDPVERKHKVLGTRVINLGGLDRMFIMELRVLTLGTRKWRRVEGCAPHYKKDHEFCFDGVVYYTARKCSRGIRGDDYLVAFDVRTESFRMITIPPRAREVIHKALLIKFEGRIAMVDRNNALSSDEIVMWILEDLDRKIWKKRVFVLPPCWEEIVADCKVFPAGTVHSGELLFMPRTLSKPSCVFYYNLKTNGFRRSEICGLPEHGFYPSPEYCVLTFPDHVESLLSPGGLASRN